MTVEIIAVTKVRENFATTIIPEIIEILKIKPDDEIFWILNEKNNVIIRKSTDELTNKEIIIGRSLAKLVEERIEWNIYIPKDVRDILYVPPADRVLWLSDKKDIIIRNPILSDQCSRLIVNEDVHTIIIYASKISKDGLVTIPKEVRDILGLGEKILWIFDHKNIIIKDTFLPDICLS